MDHLFEHYKKTGYLHHAHIIKGAGEEVSLAILSSLERHMGVTVTGNPDLSVRSYESFGVDDARSLSIEQSRAGLDVGSGARKIFIITVKSFTREAQNALLKTFEEPTEGTHFFIIIPRLDTLLPTLKSRVILVEGSQASLKEDDTKALAEKFLSASLEERFAMAKKLTEVKKGESVNREKIRRILDHIERILYTQTAGKKDAGDIFREIYQAKTYLNDRGSSAKMLLDHLAIVVNK